MIRDQPNTPTPGEGGLLADRGPARAARPATSTSTRTTPTTSRPTTSEQAGDDEARRRAGPAAAQRRRGRRQRRRRAGPATTRPKDEPDQLQPSRPSPPRRRRARGRSSTTPPRQPRPRRRAGSELTPQADETDADNGDTEQARHHSPPTAEPVKADADEHGLLEPRSSRPNTSWPATPSRCGTRRTHATDLLEHHAVPHPR